MVEAKQHPVEVSELPESIDCNSQQSSERVVEIHDGSYRWVITLRTSLDPATEDWVSVAKEAQPTGMGEEIRRLTVDLSLVHPFSSEFLGANNENVELLLRISTAVCIALVMAEDASGYPPEEFLFQFNYLMRGVLARASLNHGDINSSSENSQASLALDS